MKEKLADDLLRRIADMTVQKEKSAANVPDWANIPGELLSFIADLTHNVRDVIRMSAVCRSWQASLMDRKKNFPLCLMVTEIEDRDKRCLYNISEEIFVELDLPEIRGWRCWGSPFGWLITCALDLEVQLFNPLSRASFPLPSLRTLPCSVIKLILLTSPDDSESDCIVMAIYALYTNFIALAKPGDQRWTQIRGIFRVDDVIYFKGNIYASHEGYGGDIYVCEDLDGDYPEAVKFVPAPSGSFYHERKYLFELGGNLCLASRGYAERPSHQVTYGFEIFKMDMQTRMWEMIYSLGESSLFLGNCSTFAIAATDYCGCRPNCIYFTDDHPMRPSCIYFTSYPRDSYNVTGGLDIGIYDCEKLKFDLDTTGFDIDSHNLLEPFPKKPKDVQHNSFCRSLWIIPYSR